MGWMFVRRKALKRIEEYRDGREGSEVLGKKKVVAWSCYCLRPIVRVTIRALASGGWWETVTVLG